MKNPRIWPLVAALAGTTAAMAQNPQPTIRPTAQKAEGVVVPVRKSTDLVIDAVSWAYNTPRGISERGAPTERILQSPRLRITLRNAGTSVWASSGRMTALVIPGTPEEIAADAANPRGRSGVNVVDDARPTGPAVLGSIENIGSAPPFRGAIAIPGSLAPGEKRTIEITLEGRNRNADARKRLKVSVDKFYTARVDIEAKGDDQLNNNGANLMFRLDASGQAVGPMFTPRATDPAQRGTVEVRAPGS